MTKPQDPFKEALKDELYNKDSLYRAIWEGYEKDAKREDVATRKASARPKRRHPWNRWVWQGGIALIAAVLLVVLGILPLVEHLKRPVYMPAADGSSMGTTSVSSFITPSPTPSPTPQPSVTLTPTPEPTTTTTHFTESTPTRVTTTNASSRATTLFPTPDPRRMP